MDDFLYEIINPPASLVMWLMFSREGAEIMPSLLLFASVLSILGVLYSLRSNKN